MKRLIKYSIWFGLLLILVGFLWDVFLAGVPYQDPPADLATTYLRNQRIASNIMKTGCILLLISIAVKFISMLLRRFQLIDNR